MIMSKQAKKKELPLRVIKAIVFVIILTIVVVSEIFWRDPLFDYSIGIIEDIQDVLNDSGLEVVKFITFIDEFEFLVIVSLLIFNYSNIYKTYILLGIANFTNIVAALMKIIYSSPRPYFESSKISGIACEAGWGNPSSCTCTFTAFMLTLWKILFDNPYMRKHNKSKVFVLFVFIVIILMDSMCVVILGMHSINQVIYGGIIGVFVFVFFFEILEVNFYDYNQLFNYMNSHILNETLLCIGIVATGLGLFYCRNEEIGFHWKDRIYTKCPDESNNMMFHKEALLSILTSSTYLTAHYGLKFEYFFSFQTNVKRWREYNFDFSNIEEVSLDSRQSINLTYKTQWNKTNNVISVIRLILIYFISFILLLSRIFLSYDISLWIVIPLKMVLPMIVFYFFVFYFGKLIFKSFNLTNISFAFLHESVQFQRDELNQLSR